MSTGWRALLRRILTPNTSAVLLDKRGFYVKDEPTREMLEAVGRTFLLGYGFAVGARSVDEAEENLERIPDRFRGFAYEGAGMGFAMLDGLPFGRSDHTARFLASRGDEHVYTAYVGVGWAMARLPRFRWPSHEDFDPLLRWLMFDGYGFHQTFFRTQRWVHEQYLPASFDWIPGYGDTYALRALDQGVGRAMWFVGGADAERVTALIDRFPEHRRADLYSGTGLAATYAGGGSEDELQLLRDRAGEHRGALAQASAFAAEARVRGGIVVPHTELASRVLTGAASEQAARITHDARKNLPVDGKLPAYETWRKRVANEFAVLGG